MSTVEFHPWNSRRADTERPDEWRIDLDPMPRCEFATVRRVAPSCTRSSASSAQPGGPRPRAARASTSTSGSAAVGLRRGAAGRARLRPRGRAPHAGRRHDHLVAQGPRPRHALRRLQPERPRPHDRQRVLGTGRPRGDRIDPDQLGRDRRGRPPPVHHRHRARPLRRLGDLHQGIDDGAYSLDTLLEWADRDGLD